MIRPCGRKAGGATPRPLFSGAEVDGTFSGDFNETFYDVPTNENGVAVFQTSAQVRVPSFTFCVDDVTHSTLVYDPNDNVETCDTN